MGLTDYDFLVKLLLIGDSGVGKSNILMKYVDGVSCESYIATIGIDFKIKTIMIGNKRVKLQIWDTAGQERFRTITHSYYRGAQGVIVVYDQTDKETFGRVKKWLDDVSNKAGDNIPKILVGNKSDLESKKVVTTKEGKDLADEYKIKFFETSAMDGTNIDKLFETLAKDAIDAMEKNNYEFPKSAMNQNMFNKPSTSCCS
jgi:small GTP-binding protein